MNKPNPRKLRHQSLLLGFYFAILIFSIITTKHITNNYIIAGNDEGDGFIFGMVLLIGGLVSFYNSLKNLKKKRLFENIPTSKMRSIAMGLVELKGKIKIANETLTDPFDEKDCVYWKVKIEEYVKRGKRRTWVTRHQLTKSVKFLLSDDTGTVLINSQKADMTNIKRDSEIQTATLFSEELPDHIKKYCDRYKVKYKGWFGFKKKLRCRATYLEPGDQLYVLGSARPLSDDDTEFSEAVTAVVDHSDSEHFLISDKSEKHLTDRYGGQSWKVPVSIIVSSFGLWMILVSIGMFK